MQTLSTDEGLTDSGNQLLMQADHKVLQYTTPRAHRPHQSHRATKGSRSIGHYVEADHVRLKRLLTSAGQS